MIRGVASEPAPEGMTLDMVPISLRPRFHSAALPTPRTSFVGREREIDLVLQLLARSDVRLLTLTGPGGVGKTRIATRVIASIGFARHFVELADVQQPDLVLPAIAATLGVHAGGRPLIERLSDALRDDDHLLVLDNFEQILPAAEVLIDLLDACPGLKLLVTSRALLGVPGEYLLDIRPFTLPVLQGPDPVRQAADYDVCRLFVDRARALDPDFAFTSANAQEIVRICQRVEGLPLAVELAAAWVSVLSPPALVSQLEQCLALPRNDGPGIPQRQRTIQDTIAWSYGLLAPSSQALFRRLSLFMGGCTLDAIMDVCSDGKMNVLQELRVLVANSLVRRIDVAGAESRYLMLETVREFGLERLEASGEAGVIRQRYAAYLLALAKRVEVKLNTNERTPWLDRLEAEQGNLHNALAWALEREDAEFALDLAGTLLPFWQFHFHSRAGREWIRQALALGRPVSALVMRKALYCAGMLACLHGDTAEAAGFLNDALAQCLAADDSHLTGLVEIALGRLAWDNGDAAAAQTWFERANARFERHDDTAGRAQSLHYMGLVAHTNGDYELATMSLGEALRLWQSLGFSWELACCIPGHLADVARAEGDLAGALPLYQECLALNWDRQDLENVAWSFAGLAMIALSDDLVEASARWMALAELFRARTVAPLTPHIERDHHLAVRLMTERVGAARYAAIRAEVANTDPTEGVAAALAMTRSEARSDAAPAAGPELTQRERDVLRLIATGKSNQEIADLLFLSPGTVKVHVTHILGKLGVRSRSAATDYAHRHRLI